MQTPRNIVILGVSGSVGQSALKVLRHLPERFRLCGVAGGARLPQIAAAAREFAAPAAACAQDGDLGALRALLPTGCRAASGEEALVEMCCRPEVDVVLCAIVGTAGLRPVLAALRAGKTVALASKEILVMAGELVMAEAARHGGRIIPVDSEHSAIFQCLAGQAQPRDVRRLILTCSGGPFLRTPQDEMDCATPAQALRHPTWDMGPKISIDSASLMNKALEIVEARWLFGVTPEQVEVVIHPQSVIHSMVEFCDHTVIAQLSAPDMVFPIQYALTWPMRAVGSMPPFDFSRAHSLSFEPPDRQRFPSLDYAYRALAVGGAAPAVLNAANEVAVQAFLQGQVPFAAIHAVIGHTLACQSWAATSLEDILQADAQSRRLAHEYLRASYP